MEPFSNLTTSLEAAEGIAPFAAGLEIKVLDLIRANGGMTCFEVETLTRLSHQTASARIRGLAKKGLIEDSGDRRLTETGRRAIVWK